MTTKRNISEYEGHQEHKQPQNYTPFLYICLKTFLYKC